MSSAPMTGPTPEEVQELARRHGLTRVGTRPPFVGYLRELWAWRGFTWALARGRYRAAHQGNQLGRLWAVLNPVLLIGSYFVIFGVLLQTNMGPGDRIAFLAPGVILFSATASIIGSGSRAVANGASLMRSLRFPRALLPTATALTELLSMIPALAVLLVALLMSGVRPSASWLLFPVAVLLHFGILLGLALVGARLVHASRDVGNLIPVLIRLLRYVSGVFFSIDHYAGGTVAGTLLRYQPFALPLETARQALLPGAAYRIVWSEWLLLGVWSFGLLALGLWAFWTAEDRYGSR